MSKRQKRYVIFHAENAWGHPMQIPNGIWPFVYGDRDLRQNNLFWKKGGVFMTRNYAEEYARDNCVANTYRIVEIDRKE